MAKDVPWVYSMKAIADNIPAQAKGECTPHKYFDSVFIPLVVTPDYRVEGQIWPFSKNGFTAEWYFRIVVMRAPNPPNKGFPRTLTTGYSTQGHSKAYGGFSTKKEAIRDAELLFPMIVKQIHMEEE